MDLGTLTVNRRWASCLFVFLALICTANAQQTANPPSGTDPGAVPTIPAGIPAAQPAPNGNATELKPAIGAVDPASKDSSNEPPVVKFGAGDLLEVSVYNVPELASKARVSNAGDIYLPLIDYVHVEGLTLEEAQALIEKRLEDGGFVRNPHVTIFVDEAASQGVTVLGEVGKPGIYPDLGDHRLYQIISEAGGFSQAASRKIAIIRRNQPEPVRVSLPRNLGDDLTGNVEIMPGDTITVPRAPIIYIVGDVGRPSGLLVDNGTLTVLQALALAGGANRTARLGDARIIRKGPSGMTETKIAINKMLEAKKADVTLEADDILFIPVSGAKVAAGRGISMALQAASAITIYTVHP